MNIELFKSSLLSYLWNLHIQDPMTELTYNCDNID
jgi:hypothetical protein